MIRKGPRCARTSRVVAFGWMGWLPTTGCSAAMTTVVGRRRSGSLPSFGLTPRAHKKAVVAWKEGLDNQNLGRMCSLINLRPWWMPASQGFQSNLLLAVSGRQLLAHCSGWVDPLSLWVRGAAALRPQHQPAGALVPDQFLISTPRSSSWNFQGPGIDRVSRRISLPARAAWPPPGGDGGRRRRAGSGC